MLCSLKWLETEEGNYTLKSMVANLCLHGERDVCNQDLHWDIRKQKFRNQIEILLCFTTFLKITWNGECFQSVASIESPITLCLIFDKWWGGGEVGGREQTII